MTIIYNLGPECIAHLENRNQLENFKLLPENLKTNVFHCFKSTPLLVFDEFISTEWASS